MFTVLSIFRLSKKNIYEFLRAQIAAFIGTALDYSLFLVLTELVGVWYVYANIASASLGAITNFLLGRYWAFNNQEEQVSKQIGKYALVSFGSLVLNTSGIYALTEWGGFNEKIAKVIVGIVVAICFNFMLQKHFVFKKTSPPLK